MPYLADPGGVFESDTHRRTLAHLPLPKDDATSVEDLVIRMQPDASTNLNDEEEMKDVLSDLESDGYAVKVDDGWKMTDTGLSALNAPVPGTEVEEGGTSV